VRYYNLAIAKTYLTQQTELGSTETGARALGEVFYDQMGGIVQADCEALANLINNALIVPLVRYNFGEQEFYPTFAPSQRVRAGSGVASVLSQLITSKAIHPRPEDEAYLRDVFELPTSSSRRSRTSRTARDAQAAAIAAAGPNGDGNGPPAAAEGSPAVRIAAHVDVAPRRARRRELAMARRIRPCLARRRIARPSTRRGSTASSARRAHARSRHADVAHDQRGARCAAPDRCRAHAPGRVARRPWRSCALRRRARHRRARQAPQAAARVLFTAAHARARRTAASPSSTRSSGSSAQRDRPAARPAACIPTRDRLVAGARARRQYDDETSPADLHLAAEVDRAVEEEIDRREQSARSAALTALAQAAGAIASVLAPVASTAAKAGLIGLSTGRTQSNVEGVVNVGFGIGRSETAQSIADPVVRRRRRWRQPLRPARRER
jgi:hypothetical protein